MFTKSITCLVLTGLILIIHGYNEEEWEEIIRAYLKSSVDQYNKEDIHGLVQYYTVNAHRLPPKLPLAIGHEAIEEQYNNFPIATLAPMVLTHVPYSSDDAAVFEFSSSVKGTGITFKGVGLFVIEDGQPKIAMFTYNYDK